MTQLYNVNLETNALRAELKGTQLLAVDTVTNTITLVSRSTEDVAPVIKQSDITLIPELQIVETVA